LKKIVITTDPGRNESSLLVVKIYLFKMTHEHLARLVLIYSPWPIRIQTYKHV